jgi:hypothetical protein
MNHLTVVEIVHLSQLSELLLLLTKYLHCTVVLMIWTDTKGLDGSNRNIKKSLYFFF